MAGMVRPSAELVAMLAAATLARADGPRTIALNFPGPVPVQTLVDYVSARLGVSIVYDDDQLKKAGAVVIRAPDKVSPDELTALLSNVLATKKLALVRDVSGAMRVADAASVPPSSSRVERVQLKYAEAARLAPQVKQLVSVSAKDAPLEVSFDGRTNQLILVGSPAAVEDALAVARLVDVAAPTELGTLQFYKLTNATAADVLDTIRDLEGRPPSARPRASTPTRNDTSPAVNATGSPANPSGQLATNRPAATFGQPTAAAPQTDAGPVDVQPTNGTSTSGRLGGEAVTADPNTNTIIVRGGPEVQRTYKQLIATLDKRRPQVLLEATVVTIDTSHNFTFGVELSAHSNGLTRLLSFTQFGLSSVDVATGRLTPHRLHRRDGRRRRHRGGERRH